MERKKLIAIVVIAIILVGVLGWYFFLQPQPEPPVLLKVYIDGNDYTAPLVWNLTAVNGTTVESLFHELSNNENVSINTAFSFTVWHLNTTTNHWIQEYNGTNWLVSQNVGTILVSAANQTGAQRTALAFDKNPEKSTYHVTLRYTDHMIYVTFQYPGDDPTVDGETVFAYLAFDGNGNSTIDGNDKAFNFTSNPNRTSKNQLKVYTQLGGGWNTTATTYEWNENVSPSTMPVTIVFPDDRKTITWAIPFTYIGAQRDASLGFIFQAYGHDWGISGANSTTPSKFAKVTLSLPLTLTFTPEPFQTIKFFIKVWFLSKASGDYSFVFRATVRSAS